MLYRPVYLKGGQAPIMLANPPPPTPPERFPTPELPPEEPPLAEVPEEQAEEESEHLPMLVSNSRDGFRHVIPPERTKDVLTGKCAYLLVDESGVTRLGPKHVLNALKLDKERRRKYEDFECVGGHRRVLEERPAEEAGKRRYKRRYVSLEYIAKGIYGVRGRRGRFRYYFRERIVYFLQSLSE